MLQIITSDPELFSNNNVVFFTESGTAVGNGGLICALMSVIITPCATFYSIQSIALADYEEITEDNAISISFPTGLAQTEIVIHIIDDRLVEGTEWFLVHISCRSIDGFEIFAPTATINVADNDGVYM